MTCHANPLVLGWRRFLGRAAQVSPDIGPTSRHRRRGWLIEPLETRALLSTITVSSIGDTGPGTLRAAIEQANLDTTADTIAFAPTVTGTITLKSALPDLTGNISIAGPGARR